ncbi:hypothetical protein BCR34DRAFT_530177, partial [Clohesyomyces aquaticus]
MRSSVTSSSKGCGKVASELDSGKPNDSKDGDSATDGRPASSPSEYTRPTSPQRKAPLRTDSTCVSPGFALGRPTAYNLGSFELPPPP